MSIRASVIIATYNRERILKKTLPAICDQTADSSEFEVLLVDDGSTDSTEELYRQLKPGSNFNYIKLKKCGAAKARNEGIRQARGEIIIFIDSDIVVKKDFIAQHLGFHKDNEKIIVRGPVVATYDIENPFNAKIKVTDISRAFFATGNTSVKKEFLLRAGLFDENFTEYGWEDLELGIRLKRLGLSVVDNYMAVGYHFQKRFTLEGFDSRCLREKNRAMGAVVFLKKWPLLDVRLMTQDLFIFLIIQKTFFSLLNILPDAKKVISFLVKHKKSFWLGVYVNFYFNMVYLKYLEKEKQKIK